MEQKMLLPVVIVVLIAGFLIGYYASSVVSPGRLQLQGSGGLSAVSSHPLYVDPASDFVVNAGLFETFEGRVKSVTATGWVLSSGSNELKLSDPSKTAFFKRVAAKDLGIKATSVTVPAYYFLPIAYAEVKAGDQVRATVRYDAKGGSITSVVAVKLA